MRAYRAVTEMAMNDWCDCVIRAMWEWYREEAADREWVVRDAFWVAQERYGIRTARDIPCEYVTRPIREQIEAAVDYCVGDGYIGGLTSGRLKLRCNYSES